jgi:hypothetical protein
MWQHLLPLLLNILLAYSMSTMRYCLMMSDHGHVFGIWRGAGWQIGRDACRSANGVSRCAVDEHPTRIRDVAVGDVPQLPC